MHSFERPHHPRSVSPRFDWIALLPYRRRYVRFAINESIALLATVEQPLTETLGKYSQIYFPDLAFAHSDCTFGVNPTQ
jgi:hypothetical protein